MKNKVIMIILLTIMFLFGGCGEIAFGENEILSKSGGVRESVVGEVISDLIEILTIEEEEELEKELEGELYRITYYCGCRQCCGKWATDPPIIGAYGRELIDGYSCACPLPNGTEIEIKGYGTVRVDDTTSKKIVEKYNGKIIDIYVENHANKPEGIQDYMEVVIKE